MSVGGKYPFKNRNNPNEGARKYGSCNELQNEVKLLNEKKNIFKRNLLINVAMPKQAY
jgi:hypothetical protein